MFSALFKRPSPDQGWGRTRQRVERLSAQLFASIGTPCTARAFLVPTDGDSLLLVELRGDVEWSSQSIRTARTILMQGLNAELGFKLKDEDLLVAFADPRPTVVTNTPRPAAKPAPRATPEIEFESSVIVTEMGDSQWSAFGPTHTPTLPDAPPTVALQSRPARRR